MKRVLLILGIILSISKSHANILSTEKILDNVDDLYRSNASHGMTYFISHNGKLAKS